MTIAVVKAANAAGRHSHLRIFVPEMDYSTQHVITRYTQRGTNNINTDATTTTTSSSTTTVGAVATASASHVKLTTKSSARAESIKSIFPVVVS